MLQRYGVEHNFQRQDIIEISKKASHAPEIDQKRNKKLAIYGRIMLYYGVKGQNIGLNN